MIGFFWNVLLAMIWVALTGSFSVGNMLLGFFFSYGVLSLMQNAVPALKGYSQRLPRLIRFAVFFSKELLIANLKVAYDVATPVWYMKPGVVGMPLAASTDLEITLVANFISLTPGTLSLDVSDDREILYIHAMFAEDEEELLTSLKELERRILAIMR